MATGEPEDWKSRFECVADGVIATQAKLRQALKRAEAAEGLMEKLRLRIAERRAQYMAQMMTVEACVLGWVLTEMEATSTAEALAQRRGAP